MTYINVRIIADHWRHIEMRYEIYTSPDREKLIRFSCADLHEMRGGNSDQAHGKRSSTGEKMHPSYEPEALAGR